MKMPTAKIATVINPATYAIKNPTSGITDILQINAKNKYKTIHAKTFFIIHSPNPLF